MGLWDRYKDAVFRVGAGRDQGVRKDIVLMNRELELLIREVIMQTTLRKQSWQQPGNPT